MALDLIALAAGLALIGIAGMAILNALTFTRLAAPSEQISAPQHTVSICIPARDEADVIGQTVHRLRAQTYADLEILIVDDHSSDDTRALALAAAEGDTRVHV
ncbi:MAG: glycosyltransferase family 2 protein, partial [Anaerolineae bacterium]|nr:glycosyltransferase family 2 protein [Anaerolineae bacterium]